jgi:hypothetical protein
MNLFARAAPDSDIDSEEDPAFGKVRDTVEVEDALSDTTVSPFARVVTDADPAEAASGEVAGIPGNSSTGVKRAENSLLVEEAIALRCAEAAVRRRLAIVMNME